ncbi:hypothetical protein [Streptomyces leeuwenhoekii]|nr:hypothetical protein [Streptomyces leeuwenhoekii]
MTDGDNTNTTQDTAAKRLRDLHDYYLKHPVTGPTARRAPTTSASAPLSLATLDHIQSSVREVAEQTLAANPDAGRAPSRADAVYDWCRQQTEHADEIAQQRLESIEYRHYLEHAIRAGDTKVVRRHRCPSCGTAGLLWQQAMGRATCVNLHCARRNGGLSRSWTLAYLAYEHVAANASLKECAT